MLNYNRSMLLAFHCLHSTLCWSINWQDTIDQLFGLTILSNKKDWFSLQKSWRSCMWIWS